MKRGLPLTIVLHQRLSSIKGRLPRKVVFHQRLSSIRGHLPSKVVFYQRSSSIKGRLPWKVDFHKQLSSIKGCLPLMVFFHQSSSSTKCTQIVKLVCQLVTDLQGGMTWNSYSIRSCMSFLFRGQLSTDKLILQFFVNFDSFISCSGWNWKNKFQPKQ